MRVAVAVWADRISPVLDAAGSLLLVDVEDGRETARRHVPVEEAHPALRARRIQALGADVLICGAVSWPLEALLTASGVRVIPDVCGAAEEVLGAFLSDDWSPQAYRMPGCCGRRRRFRGGHSTTARTRRGPTPPLGASPQTRGRGRRRRL